MPTSRRTFLKGAGIATAAVSAAPLALALPAGGPQVASATGVPRGYAAGHFALELDGKAAGLVAAFEGGNVVADVVEVTDGGTGVTSKSLGEIHYEPITLLVGLNMASSLWDWIEGTFENKHVRKDGAIVIADGNFNILRRMEFHQALITEVTFPALDAASKDTAQLMVTFWPEFTQLKPGSGKLVAPISTKQKAWLVSNFRLTVGDLPCNRVNKIEALTVKQRVSEFRDGNGGPPSLVAGRLQFPNLVLTFSAQDGGPWQSFFDDFVLKGNDSEDDELPGSLDYLDPTLQGVLGTLQFFHLGIFRLAPEEVDPNGTSLQRLEASLYCEGNQFTVGGVTEG